MLSLYISYKVFVIPDIRLTLLDNACVPDGDELLLGELVVATMDVVLLDSAAEKRRKFNLHGMFYNGIKIDSADNEFCDI